MSASVVRQLHTEIRIAGSPPICAAHPAVPSRWTYGHLVGDVGTIAIEADQHLVEDYVVEDRGPEVARQLVGHEPRAATAAVNQRGDTPASQFAKRGIDGEAARTPRELGYPFGLTALVVLRLGGCTPRRERFIAAA